MKEKIALSLLALVVITSGCINNNSDEPEGSVHVDYLNFMPSDREIYSGGVMDVNMRVSNIGQAPASLRMGSQGSQIFTNYCPYLFNLENFQKIGKRHLDPGESVTLSWKLQQAGKALSTGSTCRMEFRLPFNYSASVYRQIQVKSSDDVSDARNLGYESSSGPLKFEVATIAPSGPSPSFTMPEDGTKTVTVLMRMRNMRAEKGSIDIHEKSLKIKAPELGIDEGFETVTQLEVEKCSSGKARYDSSGSQAFCVSKDEAVKWTSNRGDPKCNLDELEPLRLHESKTRVIRCTVELPGDVSGSTDLSNTPSIISEIQASVGYTYTKELHSRKVEVKGRG